MANMVGVPVQIGPCQTESFHDLLKAGVMIRGLIELLLLLPSSNAEYNA